MFLKGSVFQEERCKRYGAGGDGGLLRVNVTFRVEKSRHAVLTLHHVESRVEPVADASVLERAPINQIRPKKYWDNKSKLNEFKTSDKEEKVKMVTKKK